MAGIARLLGGLALALSGLVLVLLFSDAHALSLAGQRLDFHRLRLPVAGLALLGLALAWLRRRTLAPRLARLAAGEAGPDEERLARRLVAVLVGIGFALRLARIGEYGLSPDEAALVWPSAAPTLWDVWQLEKLTSPHPPGLFVLLHALTRISWEPGWLRLPSVLCGTLLIPVCFRFGRTLCGVGTGLLLAALVTFSPSLVELSRVARNYAPGLLLLVASLLPFLRFLRAGRGSSLALWSLLACLAIAFHYALAAFVLATGLILAIELARERRPLAWWLRAAVAQLPAAALLGVLYVFHVSELSGVTERIHRRVYRGQLGFDPAALAGAYPALWDYAWSGTFLLSGWGALLLAVLAGLGIVSLWLAGRRLAVLFSVVPILTALALAAGGVLPAGGTRHSVYLFPSLFLPLAWLLSELLTGGRETRRARAGDAAPPRLSTAGALATAVLAVLLVDHSVATYAADTGFFEELEPGRPQRELLTWVPQRDVERAFALLHEHAGPEDVVLLGWQGLLTVRTEERIPPVVPATPGERRAAPLGLPVKNRPLAGRVGSVAYYYAPAVTTRYSPASLARGLAQVEHAFGLAEPPRVWILRGGWDYEPAAMFRWLAPGVAFDEEIERASHGMLFAITPAELRRAAAAAAP